MSYYISNPPVDLSDKFILSFNVDFTGPQQETICYGIDTITRRAVDVTTIDNFMNKVNRGVILDNGTTLLSHSSQYNVDKNYVWNKTGENKILGLDVKVFRDQVYEEIEDISLYDPEVDLDVCISDGKLFKYIPGRYIIDNGVIKLVFSKAKITSIFSFEKGNIVREEYHVHDHLQDFDNKIRLIINNGGSTMSLDKMVDESYEHIGTYFFTTQDGEAKVYLGLVGTNATNLSVTYNQGPALNEQQGMSLIISTTQPNQKINLGYNLGEWSQPNYGTEIVVAGDIDWGDGSPAAKFTGNEGSIDTGTNPLIHTFVEPGEYEIQINGTVRWNGFSDINDKPNSIREYLTEIFISEGDDYPVKAIAPGAFAYCKHLLRIPTGLFDFCNNITDISNCFAGCEKVSNIPKDLLYYCPSVNNFTNCFLGCLGLKIDVPNYWEDFIGATGGRCFRNCTNAIDYYTIPYDWGGPFADGWGGLVLTFTTTEADQMVDLGHILGSHSDKSEVIGGFVDWKDGGPLTDFGNGDGVTDPKFQHVYSTPGVHTIILGGKIKWGDGEWPFGDNDLRKILSSITYYEGKRSPIYDIGRYAFASTKITSIPGDIFEYCTDVQDFSGCFQGCTNLRNIPGEIFSHATGANNFTDAFKGCTGLKTVPGNIFSHCPDATTFDSTFEDCTNFDTIPDELFRTNTEATSFNSTFKNSGIDTIPPDLFSTNTKVTNFGDCFRDCMGVEEIPENLFDSCPNVTDFSGTFRHTGIHDIPAGLFDNNEDVLTFEHCFSDCPYLHTIPDGLFDNCTEVTNFSYTFANDPNIEDIPDDLFANCENVTDFSHCFDGDIGIKTDVPELWVDYDDDAVNGEDCFKGCENATNWWNIPENWGGAHKVIGDTDPAMIIHIVTTQANEVVDLGPLLGGSSANPQITNGIFAWTKDYKVLLGFRAREGVTSKILKHTYKEPGEYDIIISGKLLWSDSRSIDQIPQNDARRYITSITIEGKHPSPIYDLGTGGFAYATKLTTIPEILFNNCTDVTNFSYTFSNCTHLTTIPDELLTKCTKATNFTSCFENCYTLTNIPSILFAQCAQADTFISCFKNCTGITAAVPTYWFTYREATGTDCFSGDSNTANYFDIPEEWGGPPQTITGEAITLWIHTNSDSELVDLGYCIGDKGTVAGLEGGVIDWGDHDYKVSFHDGEGTNSERLKHTYATAGDYIITLSGKFKWGGHNVLLSNDVRKVLTQVTVPASKNSPIYELGSHAFYGASKLTTVSDKVFNSCKSASFISAFENCTSLSSIGTALLTGCPIAVTNISSMFKECRALATIPTSLFNGLTSLTNASYAFYHAGLTELPTGLFNTCTALADVNHCFSCTEITTIPAAFFARCAKLANCSYCFSEVDGNNKSTHHLTSIPADLFSVSINTALNNLTECFRDCSGITNAVPEFWRTFTNVSSHSNCFVGCDNCENWYYVPQDWGGPDIYAGTGYEPGLMVMKVTTDATNKIIDLSKHLVASGITVHGSKRDYILPAAVNWGDGSSTELGRFARTATLSHTYNTTGNHDITITGNIKWNNEYTAPANITANSLAKHLTAINLTSGTKSPINDTTYYAFNGCEKLTTIPAGLFEQHTDNVGNMSGMFENCTALTAIPDGLFDKFTKATSLNYCFKNCSNITTIPANLFKKLTNLQVLDGTFHRCTKLNTIPNGLLSANSKIRIFRFTFANTSITSVPANLFSACTTAANFEATFSGCSKLATVPSNLFDSCTHINTFAFCFDGNTAITSLPTLWSRADANDVIETCCFRGCKSTATNFATAAEKGWCHPVDDPRNITLTIKTTAANQTINLASYIGVNGNRGYINWGDGTSKWGGTSVQYSDGLPTNDNAYTTIVPTEWGRFIGTAGPMSHSFATAGTYNIKLGGAFSWKKTTAANNINTITSQIAVDATRGCPITSIDAAAFQGWTALATITGSLFGNCPTSMTSLANMFNGCTSLSYLPTGIFDSLTNLTDIQSIFYNCSNLSTLPLNLFGKNTKLQTAYKAFANSGLMTLTDDPFKTCTALVNCEGTFNNCTRLRVVNSDIFSYCTAIKTLAFCFQGDTQIQTLPKLWEKHGSDAVIETGCFMGCTRTATNFDTAAQKGWCHPVDDPRNFTLAVKTTAVNQVVNLANYLNLSGNRGHINWGDGTSSWNMNSTSSTSPTAPLVWGRFTGTEGTGETNNPMVHTFASIGTHNVKIGGNLLWKKALTSSHTIQNLVTSITVGSTGSPLFDVEASGFNGCTLLTSIPENLFDNCTNTTSFASIFENCTGLTSIPANLFSKCTKATNFSRTFYGCTKLTGVPTTLFDKNTTANNFTSTFQNCERITGAIPTLWSKHTSATGTNCFTGCYMANQYILAVQNKYAAWPNNALILTITNPGAAAITFPFERYNSSNYTVWWGDGSSKETNIASHTFKAATGNYGVIVQGEATWRGTTQAATFNSIEFNNCLTAVEVVGTCPIKAFASNVFQNCSKLTTIKGGLFNNVILSSHSYAAHYKGSDNFNYWDFEKLCYNCRQLTSIPENLFSSTSSAAKQTTHGISFESAFTATALKEVPSKLFSGLPTIVSSNSSDGILSFNNCFASSGITGIGNYPLADLQTDAVGFINLSHMFDGCQSLELMNEKLLLHLPPLSGKHSHAHPYALSAMFQGCTALRTIPSGMLDNIPNTNKVDMGSMFSGCTGVTAYLPTYWNTHNSTLHSYFYTNCSNAPNYNNVPSGWK